MASITVEGKRGTCEIREDDTYAHIKDNLSLKVIKEILTNAGYSYIDFISARAKNGTEGTGYPSDAWFATQVVKRLPGILEKKIIQLD